MPKYDFRCEACELEFSESLPMGTTDLPACPTCKKNHPVRKMIRAPMVHFKGSGFYKTDSSGGMKSKPKDPQPSEAKESPSPETGKEAQKPAETKTAETKPAEKKPESKP